MSRRYSHNSRHQEWVTNNNPSKSHQKFIPKNPNPTLCNSLSQSSSNQSNASAAPSSTLHDGGASSSRVRMGDDEEWVAASRAKGEGNFVNYLPQDEAVAAGLGAEQGGMDPVESQRVVDVLNLELSRLLKLNPREFWREVARDTSLHEFLDSFLKFRSRWYDFPHRGIKGLLAGVVVGELELSRRVFMVLYRLSSNRDPGARASDTLSSKDHAVLLQEKKLLDLPKLFDICAIYGHENEELTRVLVSNALSAQPRIPNNLIAVVSHFLGIVHTMHERCMASLEVLLSCGANEELDAVKTDYLDVMDFVNDAVVSMDAFVTAYRPAAVVFSCPVEMSWGVEELLPILAKLHDILLPSLQQGFHILLKGGDDVMRSNIAVSLKMLSMKLVSFGWKLLDICYLSGEVLVDNAPFPAVTKMFPAKVEDPVIRADILIQTFREINGVLAYLKENPNGKTYNQNLEKNYHIMSRLQNLQNAGWVFLDDEQLHYLSGIMASSVDTIIKHPSFTPVSDTNDKIQMDEDNAIVESKISQIKDLFPDYGKGFIAACLEVYNHNLEEVIQRILEGTLHEDLQSLDTSLEAMPLPKSSPTLNKKDKGKGKLVESDPIPPSVSAHSSNPAALKEQKSSPSVSSSMVGRFVRKSNDVPDYKTESIGEKDAARTAALISQYEYEDEYDDSFDDLGYSVAEIDLEESDTLNDRITSSAEKSSGTRTESSTQTFGTKWGSRKKPQFYVKDGKNYSYKVAGAVEVANTKEASLVTQSQSELIYGLGRGGNLPLGAVKKLMEYQEQEKQSNEDDKEGKESAGSPGGGRGGRRGGRGRGRGRGGRQAESHEEQDSQSDNSHGEGRGNARGKWRGRGGDYHRKDRAMKKHFSGVSGF